MFAGALLLLIWCQIHTVLPDQLKDCGVLFQRFFQMGNMVEKCGLDKNLTSVKQVMEKCGTCAVLDGQALNLITDTPANSIEDFQLPSLKDPNLLHKSMTCFDWAIGFDNKPMVEFLLKEGVDTERHSYFGGLTPLMVSMAHSKNLDNPLS